MTRSIPAQRGNQNARGKQSSHRDCGHPLTKTAREQCRRLQRAESVSEEPTSEEWYDAHTDEDKALYEASERVQTPPVTSVRFHSHIPDQCPKCGAIGDEPCKTASGGRVRSNKGRHLARDI